MTTLPPPPDRASTKWLAAGTGLMLVATFLLVLAQGGAAVCRIDGDQALCPDPLGALPRAILILTFITGVFLLAFGLIRTGRDSTR